MATHSTSSGSQQPRRAPVKAVRRGKGIEEDGAGPSKKDRDPNWTKAEILALIEAKRQEYIDEMTVDDPRELMCPELGKWGKIAVVLNSGKGEGDVHRDRDACKYKWTSMLADFKRIWDYHSRTGINAEDYFHETTAAEKKAHKLPKNFYLVAYRNMAEWLRNRATLTPPHARDTMNPEDSNYHHANPDDSAPGLNVYEPVLEEGWTSGGGGMSSPIHIHSSQSPAVSSARSMGRAPQGGMHGGHGIPPLHTASVADMGRGNAPQHPPRRLNEEFNLNAPPSGGGSPAPVRNVPGVSGHRVGAQATVNSPPAGTLPPVSLLGRRPEEIHVLSSTATSAANELRTLVEIPSMRALD